VTPQEWVPLTAVLALAVWSLVLVSEHDHVRSLDSMPDAVVEGSLVAVMAACIGGLVASLGWVDVLETEATAFVATAWRAAVLAAGVYALIGSAMDGRAR